jgi:hypothetical protein
MMSESLSYVRFACSDIVYIFWKHFTHACFMYTSLSASQEQIILSVGGNLIVVKLSLG